MLRRTRRAHILVFLSPRQRDRPSRLSGRVDDGSRKLEADLPSPSPPLALLRLLSFSDVISLVVALYAIRLATASSTAKYSYGWQRAEILGQFLFPPPLLPLLRLAQSSASPDSLFSFPPSRCLDQRSLPPRLVLLHLPRVHSTILHRPRSVESKLHPLISFPVPLDLKSELAPITSNSPRFCFRAVCCLAEVTNPMIVVIVGSFGLASNVVGLFLFHGLCFVPSSSSSPPSSRLVEAHLFLPSSYSSASLFSPSLPLDHGHSHGGGGHSHGPSKPVKKHSAIDGASESDALLPSHSHRARKDSLSSLYGHPAQTRASVVATAEQMGYGHTHDHQHVERPGSPGAASARSRSRGWTESAEDAAAKAKAKLESLVESSPAGSEHG